MSKNGTDNYDDHTKSIYNPEFTSEEMFEFITLRGNGKDTDEEREKNTKTIESNVSFNTYAMKKDYANKIAKQLFGKELNMDELKNKIDGDWLKHGVPSGFGIGVYKINKLMYDKKTDTYTAYIDSIDLNKEGNFSLIDETITSYDKHDVVQTFLLKYKKVEDSIIVMSLENKK